MKPGGGLAARAMLWKSRNWVPGSIWEQGTATFALNVTWMALSFLVTVALSRLLGATGYGTYVYAMAWPNVLAIAAVFGHSHLLARDIARYQSRGQWALVRGLVRHSQAVVLGSSAVMVLVAAALGRVATSGKASSVSTALVLALPLIPLFALMYLREATLRGMGRVPLGRFPETVVQPVLLLGLIAAAALTAGLRSAPMAVALSVCAAAGALVVGTVFASRARPAELRAAPAEYDRPLWLRSALALLGISAITVLNFQIGVLFLGTLKDVRSSALFSTALRLAGLSSFVQQVLIFPLGPSIARLYSSGQRAELQQLLTRSVRLVLLCAAPVALALGLLPGLALSVFGAEFRAGSAALVILVAGEMVNIANGFTSPVLVYSGHERLLLKVTGLTTAVGVVLNVVLILRFGVVGAAAARTATTFFQEVALSTVVWRRLGLYSPVVGRRLLTGRTRPVPPAQAGP